MCGYLEWHLNIDYQELEQFTGKTQLELGSGIINLLLPVMLSIVPAQHKPATPTSNLTASRLMPSYNDGAANGTPGTLLTSAGDEDGELKSPLRSSTASLVLQTPLSNADIDGPDGANVVVAGAQASGSMPASTVPKIMQTGGIAVWDPAKIKVTLD